MLAKNFSLIFTPIGQIPLVLLWGKWFHLLMSETFQGLIHWSRTSLQRRNFEVSVMFWVFIKRAQILLVEKSPFILVICLCMLCSIVDPLWMSASWRQGLPGRSEKHFHSTWNFDDWMNQLRSSRPRCSEFNLMNYWCDISPCYTSDHPSNTLSPFSSLQLYCRLDSNSNSYSKKKSKSNRNRENRLKSAVFKQNQNCVTPVFSFSWSQ